MSRAMNPFHQDANRDDYTGDMGIAFRPNTDISITSIGRYFDPGNTALNHTIAIWQNGVTAAPLLTTTILAASASDADGYKWVNVSIALSAGTTYRLVISETASSGDSWRGNVDISYNMTSDFDFWGSAFTDGGFNGVYPNNGTDNDQTGFESLDFVYTASGSGGNDDSMFLAF